MKTALRTTPVVLALTAATAFSVLAFTTKTPAAKTHSPTETQVEDTLRSFPALMVDDASHRSVPLKMEQLKVDVSVIGNIAVTTLDMTFYNSEERILEGELYFPLAAGQTVSRFAMEVNGVLREGVVVEKKEGRVAFEATVRKQVDPGLLEWTKGNNFRARVYPVPANGTKRIVVAYMQELKEEKGALEYYMPMRFPDKLKTLGVNVEVFHRQRQPLLDEGDLHCFRFDRLQDSYKGGYTRTDVMADKPLRITIPPDAKTQTLTEYNAGGELFFYTTVHPKTGKRLKNIPSSLTLFWDVSGSAQGRDLEKELSLLQQYIQRIGNTTVELIPFSNEMHGRETIAVTAGNCTELFGKLRAFDYDGATQLGAIDLSEANGAEIILSSDCLANFGETELTAVSGKSVCVWNSNPVSDHGNAQYIADKTRGQYIDLTTATVEEAFDQMSLQPLRFLGIAENDAIRIAPNRAASVDESFSLAGYTSLPEVTFQLQFGYGQEVTETIPVTLSRKDTGNYDGLIERIWAQKRIAELDQRYEVNKEEITRLGKKYSVVTRNTSLIVLDRVEDYAEHNIVPPKELRAEYDKLIAEKEKTSIDKQQAHMNTVIESFNERKDWWKKTFTPPPVSKRPYTVQAESVMAADMAVGFASGNAAGASGSGYDPDAPRMRESATEKKKEEKARGSIAVEAWDPQTPYLKKLKETDRAQWFRTYIALKKEYGQKPSFYIDVADFFLQHKETKLAMRVLSNIAELELENPQLLRILGHRLEQLKQYKLAISVFKEIKNLRPEEPQSYRDLGLVYAQNGEDQRAIDELYYVITNDWDGRFSEIEALVAGEMNAIISNSTQQLNLANIDPRLIAAMPVDMRVVITWDADNCDIDLWVIDPRGEKCSYQNKLTAIGGRISNDFTQGYGPEEFMIRKAIPGNYKIVAHFYGDHSQKISGPTTIQVEMTTNYGRKTVKTEAVTRRLENEKQEIQLATFTFKP